MKKLLWILCLLFAVTACDDEPDVAPQPEIISVVEDSIQVYEGNFISAGDAAVLKGKNFVFEVKMDSTAADFKNSLKAYKAPESGIIPVRVKGKVTKNLSASSYSKLLKITEVIEILAEKKDTTELGNNNADL